MSMIPAFKSCPPKGFSLLEILITIVVLSVGLMGVVSLQLKGAESTNSAYFRSQATLIADELAERMHVNSIAVSNNNYIDVYISPTEKYCDDNRPTPFCESELSSAAVSCSTAEMAVFDTYRAACDVGERLPSGRLKVDCDEKVLPDENVCIDGSEYSIIVSWGEVDDGKIVPSNITIKVQP